MVAFVVVASEVGVIWVHRESGLGNAACHNSPCPKKEISGVGCCVGDVFWIVLMCGVNSKAAAFTAGMSLEASLVLADMIVSTSHGAGKKVADPG